MEYVPAMTRHALGIISYIAGRDFDLDNALWAASIPHHCLKAYDRRQKVESTEQNRKEMLGNEVGRSRCVATDALSAFKLDDEATIGVFRNSIARGYSF